MINIYFFPETSQWLTTFARRVIRGAVLWEERIDDKYFCVVTQTGKPESNIYIEVHNSEVVRKAITLNHSELASELMKKLVAKWTNDQVWLVLPYVKDGISFVTENIMEHGSRYEGDGHMVMMTVKIDDPSRYLEWLRLQGVRILDPNTILFCDVGLEYHSNLMRGGNSFYLDYSTASLNDKMMFMHSLYSRESRREENEYHDYNTDLNTMCYYNYSKEQAKRLIYSGFHMAVIKDYTAKEVNTILEMRALTADSNTGEPTELTIDEGNAVYETRVNLNSNEGGFKDLIYPVHAIERIIRLAITTRREGEVQYHYVPITDWTVGAYLRRKREYIASKADGKDASLNDVASLIGYQPTMLKTYFKHTTDVDWVVELEEIISQANKDDVVVNTLEIL